MTYTPIETAVQRLHGLVSDLAAQVKRAERQTRTTTSNVTVSEPKATSMTLNFIEPVTIGSGTSATSGWVTYDVPRTVPKGAQALLLECEWSIASPDVGAPDLDAHIRISDSATPAYSYLLSHGRSAGEYDNIGGANQALMPYDASERKLYYNVEPPGFDYGWAIRLIGYLL